jgi:hypothetical protein
MWPWGDFSGLIQEVDCPQSHSWRAYASYYVALEDGIGFQKQPKRKSRRRSMLSFGATWLNLRSS